MRWWLVGLVLVAACRRDEAPPKRPPGTLHVRVTDGAGGPPIAARVLLLDGDEPLRIGALDMYRARQARGACRIADGAIGTWDGLIVWRGDAAIPVGGGDPCEPSPAIPFGRYRVWAWRGIEHEVWQGEVALAPGARTELTIPLERAFRVEGAVSADLHVHARDSNDSGVPDDVRVMSLLAAGVQVVGLSDHNVSGDLDAEIVALGAGAQIASIASIELGNDRAHVGVYPVPVDRAAPRGGSPSDDEIGRWDVPRLLGWGRQWPDAIVQVNHPRFRVYSLFDAAGWNGVAWPPPFPLDFDALEVLAGHTVFNVDGDRRTDDSVRDFYTFVGHGRLVTALGNSDTHHLNGVRDGVARSFVWVDDTRLDRFDEAGFVAAVRRRRAMATTGPWLDVEVAADRGPAVGPGRAVTARGGRVVVDIELSQARWSRATAIRVRIGKGDGHAVVRTIPVVSGARTTRERLTLEVGAVDTWIGVDASGDEPLPVELTGTYHLEKKRPGVVPYAIINPVLIDADGDGHVRFGAADVVVGP